MYTLWVFAFLIACVVATQSQHQVLFQNWMKQHNKSYQNDEEANVRFQNFKVTLDRIHEQNLRTTLRGYGATYGLNQFSDLTPAEFRNKVLMRPMTPTADEIKDDNMLPKSSSGAAPDKFDWRTKGVVTPVKDQEQCGSCWAFSVTENIESVWIIKQRLANSTLPLLAPQQIVDCDTDDGGCNGGNPPTAYQYVIGAGGIEDSKDYPYTGENGNCRFDKSHVVAKISSWKYATSWSSEDTMRENLVSWAPLSICVDAASWQDYQSGVMTRLECAWINMLDHCVQAVGYDMTASTPYWIVRNSWGTSWGINGYILLEYGWNTCGLTQEATSAVA